MDHSTESNLPDPNGQSRQSEPTGVNHLPIELILQIIDSIENNDNDYNNDNDGSDDGSNGSPSGSDSESSDGKYHPSRSLTSCALVCRAWNEISRSRIFHKLTIEYEDLDDRLHFLHFTAPHLASYVLEVHVLWDGVGDEPADWVATCFGSLKNLSKVHISDRMSSSMTKRPPLGIAIMSLLAAPLLRELCLTGWCFRWRSQDIDLIDLLSALSPTLEKLSLISIFCPDDAQTSAEKRVVRMGRLHTVEFIETGHQVLRQHHIECPNLQSVLIQTRTKQPWRLPLWIPLGLSRITVRLPTDYATPEFGEYICPSDMTIDVSENYSYFRCVTWVQTCINNLPFPEQLRRLTISIAVDLRYAPVKNFPDPVDYQVLTNVLQRLYKHGSLRHINLNVTIGGNGPVEAAFNQASEVEKLRNALATLFEANVLGVKLVFQRLWYRQVDVLSIYNIVGS